MGWEQALQIGGMAEQDLAGIFTPLFAGKEQRKANAQAAEQTAQAYNKARNIMTPYAESGRQDFANLRGMVQGGQFNTAMPEDQQFSFNFQADPGYQFRQQQQQNALQGSAAARGGLLSGATMKALQKYGGELASDEYNRAYERSRGAFESDRNYGLNRAQIGQSEMAGRYGRYSDLANVGLNADLNLANLAMGQGANMANLAINHGNIMSGQYQALGDAFKQQGQHLAQIGGGMRGAGSGNEGSGGNGGGGVGGFDLSSIISKIGSK